MASIAPAVLPVIPPPPPQLPALIDLSQFNNGNATENILKTGNIDLVLHNIDHNTGLPSPLPSPRDQMEALLICLFQALSSQNQPGQLICESKLKDKIYHFAKSFPDVAQDVISDEKFKNCSRLSEVIKKINYLSAGIFKYHNPSCNYIRRFGHHLYEAYFYNKNSALSLTASGIGIAFLGGGLQATLPFNDPDESNAKAKSSEAWAMFSSGVAIMASPLLQIIIATCKDEP